MLLCFPQAFRVCGRKCEILSELGFGYIDAVDSWLWIWLWLLTFLTVDCVSACWEFSMYQVVMAIPSAKTHFPPISESQWNCPNKALPWPYNQKLGQRLIRALNLDFLEKRVLKQFVAISIINSLFRSTVVNSERTRTIYSALHFKTHLAINLDIYKETSFPIYKFILPVFTEVFRLGAH